MERRFSLWWRGGRRAFLPASTRLPGFVGRAFDGNDLRRRRRRIQAVGDKHFLHHRVQVAGARQGAPRGRGLAKQVQLPNPAIHTDGTGSSPPLRDGKYSTSTANPMVELINQLSDTADLLTESKQTPLCTI